MLKTSIELVLPNFFTVNKFRYYVLKMKIKTLNQVYVGFFIEVLCKQTAFYRCDNLIRGASHR